MNDALEPSVTAEPPLTVRTGSAAPSLSFTVTDAELGMPTV